jgi:diacylglycerol kinase (ATP)
MACIEIIVNPAAGRGRGERSIPVIEAQLTGLGLDYAVTRTAYPWHAAELAQKAAQAGAQVVVAAGGDGTVNEVINGLMLAKKAGANQTCLGALPVGRGNDFAFSMYLPTELEAGCQALARSQRQAIDIGFVKGGDYPDGRFFGNGVGIGFDAVVGFEALKLKWLTGFPSYIVAAFRTMVVFRHVPLVDVILDDESIRMQALMVSVMNGRRMGGGFMMAPNGCSTDEKFDLCLVNNVSQIEMLKIIPLFMKGTQAINPAVKMRQSRKVRVVAVKGTLPAHADGETMCTAGLELEMELHPAALDLIGDGL